VGPVERQGGIELVQGLGRQVGDAHTQVDCTVGGHHAGAAAVGDDGQPVAGRAHPRRQGQGGGEQLLDGVHPDHAGPAQQGVEDVVATHQGTRMRGHGPGTGLVAADLHQHHRLQARHGTQRAHEAAGIADALDVHQDAAGGRVVGQVIEDLAEVQIGRCTARHHGGKTDAVRGGPVQHGRADGARLRHQGQFAGMRLTEREGGIEADGRALDAQAVGADEADAVLLRDLDQFILHLDALRTHLAEAGRQHHGMAHAPLAAGIQDAGHARRRRRDDGQLRRFRQLGNGGVALLVQQGLVLRVDRVDLALEPRLQHVAENDPGDRLLAGAGAEYGNGTGIEQRVEIVLAHGVVCVVRTSLKTAPGAELLYVSSNAVTLP